MKKLFFLLLAVCSLSIASAQLTTNTFTGTAACPTQGNTFSAVTNATVAPLSLNTITCNSTGNVFNTTTLNATASRNDNSYIEFSITASSGYQLNLTSLVFFRQASNSAPNQLLVSYSTDPVAANFNSTRVDMAASTSPTTGTNLTWTFSSAITTGSGGKVTFRFYPYGTQRADLTAPAASASGTFRLDDVTLNGTVNASAATPTKFSVGVPTPSSPTAGSGFSVTVTSQDNTSAAANTVANTGFTLSNTGGGTIGGTFTGTILAGTSSVVVSGITLSTAATGVTLTATRTSGDALTAATGAAFNVLAAASQLALVSVPTTGTQSTNLTSFTVQARRPDNTVDNTYTGNITIAKASGPGNLSGTVTVAAVAGVATFSTLQFDAAGTYTIQATSGSLTASTSGNIVIAGLPTLTELVVPQYMGSKTAASTNNARALFAVCLRLQNLVANTTYDIKAGLALTSDAATSYGAGNVWNGASGFGGTAQVVNNAFTTDGTGDSGPFWVIFQPTGNGTRFDAGQIHNVRLGYVTAGGSLPANAVFVGTKTITALDIASTARTGATTDDGAFIKGSACSSATGKYVLLYDNTNGTGDPLFSYQVMAATATNSTQSELPTAVNDVFLQSGTAATGDYAAVIPIGANNANGVRRIESRNANNTVYASSTDADGIWPGGANTTTVARRGVATVIATDAELVPQATTPATQDNNITFGTVTSTSIQLSWTNQGAGNHLVYINTSNTFTNPTDNNTYSANNVYVSGLQAVYNGTSNTVTVSNLAPSTTYFFRVYGYNNSLCTYSYNTATATNNPRSTATLAPPPGITTSVSSLSFGNVVVNQTYELSYTVTGVSLTNPLTITANAPFKISLTSGSGYTSSINLGSGNIATTTIYVAFTPTGATSYSDVIANVSSGATTQNVSVTGTGLATTLTTSVSSLASFGNQIVNTSSTTPKSFTVTGANLPSDITITAPTGFEVCLTSGGTYTSSVTLTVSGASNPSGGSVSAVIVYVKFHPISTGAYSDVVTVSAIGASTQNVTVSGNGTPAPVLTELVVPKYIGSKSAAATNNTRTPFAVCLQIDNITPNTAYDIQLGVGLTSDAATVLGAANIWNGSAFSGQILTTAFTTNASGSSGPFWIYIQPTGNGTRFGGGQIHNLRLNYRVNGGSFTANPDFVGAKTFTSLDIATTALTGATTDDGAFVKGSSFACSAGKYILLYDNVAGTGDPLYSYQSRTSTATNTTQTELPTAINDVFLQSGTSTTGDFGAVIPIGANNANGVRRVEARNANNTFFAASTDADGIWGSGANTTTVGRRGVVTLTSTDIPLSTSTAAISGNQTICNSQSATLTINFTGTAPYTYSYTDGVTTYGPFTTSSTSVSPTVSPSSDKTYTISAAYDASCTAVTSGSAVVTVTPTPTWYLDADNDGHYVGSPVTQCTTPGAGYNITATSSGDCNDNDNTKWQNALLYIDADNDNYDNGTATVCYGATIPSGYKATTLGSDCNDNDNTKHATFNFYADTDGDGFGAGSLTSVCAVNASTPPAGYSLNGTDCAPTDNSKWQNALLYIDADNDNYDNGTATVCYGATIPTGYKATTLGSDCDDNDNTKHATFNFYADTDGDGFGAGSLTPVCAVNASTPPSGYSLNGTDCAPTDNSKWQSALLYIDADNDNYDNGTATVCYGAGIPAGYSATTLGNDCNDNNASLNISCAVATYTWTGASSTLWTLSTNWTPVAPIGGPNTNLVSVIIPAAPIGGVFPQLTATKTVKNITMQGGASLDIAASVSLNVSGNWIGGTGTHVTGSGSVILNGITLQSITGTTKFTNLRLDNVAGANVISGSSQITNALELKKGVLTVNSAAYLSFASTSSAQCAIIDNFSSGFTGSISGQVKMQRYYDAPTSPTFKTQHYMGSPADQTAFTQFGANGLEGYIINTKCDEKASSSGSPYGNVAQYDENAPGAATCDLQGWKIVKLGNTENGRGYSVSKSGAGTLTITGSPNQVTSYSRTGLTNSGWINTTFQGHTDTSGWHIVSNPWLANLELSTSGGAGMDNQVAVWQTTGAYAGGYHYYQKGFDVIDIAPFQAFLVHKTAVGGTATYTINGADRVRTPASVQFHSQTNDQELAINVDNANGLRDRTVVAFNTDATNSFDPIYDGNKLWGDPARQTLYTENNGMPMARNTLNSINTTSTVNMGFDAGLPGTFTMTFEGLNTFDATSYITLEDRKTNTMHDVRSGNYTFTGDTADSRERFILHFTAPAQITKTDATCSTQGTINVTQPGTANWNYTIANSSAVAVGSGSLNTNNPIAITVAPGVYTITLVDNNNYTVVKQVQVNGAQQVTATFNTSATTVEQDADVTFTSTSTNATNNNWNFGDNATANGMTTIHSYTSPGTYNATLTSDNSDCNAVSTQQITVTAKATTGISNLTDSKSIAIWSADNTVYVDMSKQPKVEATIEIYNVLGQQLSNEKFGRSSIYTKELTNLEAAYVIVRVKNNDEITTKKVFIAN